MQKKKIEEKILPHFLEMGATLTRVTLRVVESLSLKTSPLASSRAGQAPGGREVRATGDSTQDVLPK